LPEAFEFVVRVVDDSLQIGFEVGDKWRGLGGDPRQFGEP